MFLPETTTPTLMTEALRLAQILGWPVVRGAHLVDGSCSCLAAGCRRPGLHPATADWQRHATRDRGRIEAWWTRHPRASIVLPTGTDFDVLDLPSLPASEVLGTLEKRSSRLRPSRPDQNRLGQDRADQDPQNQTPHQARPDQSRPDRHDRRHDRRHDLGPVAATAEGRALFFVQPGARATAPEVWDMHAADLRDGLNWPLRLYGRDGYVIAPPSGVGEPPSVTWLIPPLTPDGEVRALPSAADLLPAMATACRQYPVTGSV